LRYASIGRLLEQSTAAFQVRIPSPVGEQAEMSDSNQVAGQDVKQEPAQELMGRRSHNLLVAAVYRA
jgi:hypothetical protein